MPFPALRKIALSILALPACFAPLCAQNGAGLHRYDAPMARFSENGRQDSFRYYAGQKAALARQADSLAIWGWTQWETGNSFSGDNEEALRQLGAALDNRWREPAGAAEWEPFLYILATRGWYLFQTGRVWQSVQTYDEAAQLYEHYRYPDFEVVEEVYKPLGNHYTRLGDNEKALAVFQKALLTGGDNETLAGLYANIGIACWNMGDLSAAESNYRQGLSLSGVSDEKRGLLYGRLAETLLDRGMVAEAGRTANQALTKLRRVSPDRPAALAYRARARRVAGLACVAGRHYGEAARHLAGALADDHSAGGKHSRELSKDYVARSQLLRMQGSLLLALRAANEALQAVLPHFQPLSDEENPSANSFYEESSIVEALEAKAAAAQLLFQNTDEARWLRLALDCYNLAWQAESRLRQIFQYSSSKLNIQRKARASEEAAMHAARLLFEKTGQTALIEEAFAIAERSKATLLLEAVQENLVHRQFAGSDARFNQITALLQSRSFFERNILLHPNSEQLTQWRAEADALTGKITALERALAADYPALARAGSGQAATPPLPGDLAEGEALVEYFAGNAFIEIFTFRANEKASWRRLPNDADLQLLTEHFLLYFKKADAILNDPGGYIRTAYRLWQAIMPPESAAASKWLIVPDGVLNYIPFEALVAAEPGSATTLRNAAYIIRSKEVRYAWSLAVLRRQNQLASPAERHLLAIAPGFAKGERGLSPLFTGKSEWQSAGWWGRRELTGPKADWQFVRQEAANYRILHFSTHAFADSLPRIELYDQPLLLPELYALPLRSDLVVLSACQTGLGLEQRGEGVMSLARAFGYAGAACVVSSLWSVNDRSTVQLLTRFYTDIGAGKMVSNALREAKLAYLNDPKVGATAQSPYFWAGFLVVGADRAPGGGDGPNPLLWLVSGVFTVLLIYILHQNFVQNRQFQSNNRPAPNKTK